MNCKVHGPNAVYISVNIVLILCFSATSSFPCSALQPDGTAGAGEPAAEGWGCQGRCCPSWEPCGWGAAETAGRKHSLAEECGRCVEALLGMCGPWGLSRVLSSWGKVERLQNQACLFHEPWYMTLDKTFSFPSQSFLTYEVSIVMSTIWKIVVKIRGSYLSEFSSMPRI